MKKTNQIDIRLGKEIINQRIILGLSRKQLAEAIGITHQQLHKYENGVNRISVSRLYDISTALRVEIIDFFQSLTNSGNENPAIENRMVIDIIRHINRIKDESQLHAIKNLVKSISVN